MPLAIILLSATVCLPIGVLWVYHRWVLRVPYHCRQGDLLVPLAAAALQFLASTVPYFFLERLPANFLHHAIGGGVVVAIIASYVQRRLWPDQPVWIQMLFVLAAVNVLGNANEILELIGELTTGVAYIATKLDTNIDLVANNVGGAVGFGIILIAKKAIRRRQT